MNTPSEATNAQTAAGKNKKNADVGLSIVSQKWDGGNKGYLTDAERQLRRLDTDGTGTLSSDQLAAFASLHDALREENRQIKRVVWALGSLTAVLCVGTIVASVLAARANQPVEVGPHGRNQLLAKGTGRTVVTEAEGISILVQQERTSAYGSGAGKNDSTIHCVSMDDAARLYGGFNHGTAGRLLFNSAVDANNNEDEGSWTPHSLPGMAVEGKHCGFNDTHAFVGDVLFDISPTNPCATCYAAAAVETNNDNESRRRILEILQADIQASTGAEIFKERLDVVHGTLTRGTKARLQRRALALYDGHLRELWEDDQAHLRAVLRASADGHGRKSLFDGKTEIPSSHQRALQSYTLDNPCPAWTDTLYSNVHSDIPNHVQQNIDMVCNSGNAVAVNVDGVSFLSWASGDYQFSF